LGTIRALDSDDSKLDPVTFCGTRHVVQTSFYRSPRVRTQYTSSPIKHRMERPDLRSRGRPTPIGL
jgi:hypothetical protein